MIPIPKKSTTSSLSLPNPEEALRIRSRMPVRSSQEAHEEAMRNKELVKNRPPSSRGPRILEALANQRVFPLNSTDQKTQEDQKSSHD